MKTLLKSIKKLVNSGIAEDMTHARMEQLNALKPYMEQVAYSLGKYGVTGGLWHNAHTGKLYAITARSTALFVIL